MNKKIMLLGLLSLAACQVHARRGGGDAFIGGFGGSMLGSVVGSAVTAPRSSGSSGDNSGALNSVWDAMRRLEASFADEVKRLKERINELEDHVRNLRASGRGKKRGHGRGRHEGRGRGRMHEGSMPARDANSLSRPELAVAGSDEE
ncbi:hypothetical protein K2W90_00550 [Candidatus Babeliales bacterium]|nr:hypothetical protein [Candidatus Babeliales bacterium]